MITIIIKSIFSFALTTASIEPSNYFLSTNAFRPSLGLATFTSVHRPLFLRLRLLATETDDDYCYDEKNANSPTAPVTQF